MADQELVKKWLLKADNDFFYAKASLEDELKFFDLICFHFQQSAEKYLKAYIIAHDLEFRKIHDLAALVETCKRDDSSFSEIQEACLFLQRFYIEPRYPASIMFDYTKEDAEKALESAEIIRAFVIEKLKHETLPK